MSPIDRDKITKLMSQVIQSRNELTKIAKLTKEEFLKNSTAIGAVKYYMVIGIEAMIDIGNHIVSREKLGVPEDYADVFKVVNKLKIFPDELESQLIHLARYRNKLVHLYHKIDDEKVYNELKNNIQSFEQFEKLISEYLKNQKM